jgi:hypothetical protein
MRKKSFFLLFVCVSFADTYNARRVALNAKGRGLADRRAAVVDVDVLAGALAQALVEADVLLLSAHNLDDRRRGCRNASETSPRTQALTAAAFRPRSRAAQSKKTEKKEGKKKIIIFFSHFSSHREVPAAPLVAAAVAAGGVACRRRRPTCRAQEPRAWADSWL